MRFSACAAAAAVFAATAAAAPLKNGDLETLASLSKLAADHPELKPSVEKVLEFEYFPGRPAKRDNDKTATTLKKLAADHPELKESVETILAWDYGLPGEPRK